MLDKVRRTLSETITSVEDPIELSQKGQVVLTKSSNTYTFVPTTIKNPKLLTITPHMEKFSRQNASAGVVTTPYVELKTANVPDSGIKLYSAASVFAGGSYLTNVSLTNTKLGQLFINNGVLYRAKFVETNSATIGAVLASPTMKATYLEQVPYSENVKFMKVLDVSAATTLAFAFEVKGY